MEGWLRSCDSLPSPHFAEKETEAREMCIPPLYTEVNGRWGGEARPADSWSNVCVHMCSCAHMYTVCMHTMCVHACICILSLISHSVMKGFVFAKEQRLQGIHGEKIGGIEIVLKS